MKNLRFLAALLPLLLAGCLEVEQHPTWIDGKYDGKQDRLPQQAYFHNDRLAWYAAINNRNQRQNEYNRTNP
ncbi:MAG TPA: hypothetical protein VJ698_00170 [Noviherbaspirillum sp.]|uniref:hypothetical protein n=1 Tax=Noviherbaspirillum sp. TaxID=1926288 RepID=UPI002B48FF73|nr:hypothetical protein [Noviherbaspirillum sp.]HJV83859.1 hypothetical protein [Noviherbaspirillum sp.]